MSNFSEHVAINKLELDDLVNEMEQLKNQKNIPIQQAPEVQEETKQKSQEMNPAFSEVINSLPAKNRELASDMIKLLLKGELFGYDANTGHILKYVPHKNARIRVKCSNLRDILAMVTKQLGPNQQGITEENMVEGVKDFLEMLSATPFGTSQLNDPNLRRMFLKFRKDKLT